MGKYSSDSESSPSSRRRKPSGKSHRRSSSRSSSGSHYTSRCRKGKKYKKSRRSRSREKRSKSSRDGSRDRYWKSRERRKSRSGSRSKGRRGRRSRSRRREKKQHSSSSSPHRDDSLLARLNKAAVEAMSKPNKENDNSIESQLERDKAIKEINSSGFVQRSFVSNATNQSSDDPAAVVIDLTAGSHLSAYTMLEISNSVLHHNLLMENQEDKLNRWVKKLFQIRQRSINGEPLQLA